MSNKKEKNGFTIIELLIASLIIIVGFLSVVSMIVNAFTRTMPLSNNLTASYLAQEGFEVVRRIRDKNFNKRNDAGPDWYWAEGIIPKGESETHGSIYYDSTELGNNSEEYFNIDSEGLYSYSAGEQTVFKRRIDVERKQYTYKDGETGEYLLIKVTVTWKDKGETKTYEASTHLFNWY